MAKWGDLRLAVTPKMQELLSSALSGDDLPTELRKETSTDGNAFVSVSCLRQLYNNATEQAQGNPAFFFHDLVEGSELSMPPLPKRERNPELVARLERLKAQLAHQEYNKMVENVSHQTDETSTGAVAADLRQMTRQLTVVFNTILTVVGAFIFGFMASKYLDLSYPAQMSVGLFAAMIVFFADLYFIIRTEARWEPSTEKALKKMR